MVSVRTAAFFALIVACASQVFGSPLPTFDRESRDLSPFKMIKAYQRRALTSNGVDFGKRATGINTMPAEMATMSDGTSIKAYQRRQVDDTTDITNTNQLATTSDTIVIPAEVATSSDGSGPVPIRKRDGGINTMPAEMATMSDGTSIKAYQRRQVDDTTDITNTNQLATTSDTIVIPAEVATSSDGSGPVPIRKRDGGINTMPAEMATMSDGTSIKAYQRRQVDDTTDITDPTDDLADTTDPGDIADPTDPTDVTSQLPSPGDIITIPAEVATSSDGTGPVPIGKRASGINTMPAEMATTSDGTSIKAYGV